MNSNTGGPRIGGANLQCLILAGRCDSVSVGRLANQLCAVSPDRRVTITADQGVFQHHDLSLLPTQQLQSWLEENKWTSVEIETNQQLDDILATVTFTVYCHLNVAVLSTLEDMMWAFSESPDLIKVTRLEAFLRLCRVLARELDASHALVGSEPCSPSEFASHCTQLIPPPPWRPEDTLSPEGGERLYKWYRDEYLTRWQ
jgi:hypothetical protein